MQQGLIEFLAIEIKDIFLLIFLLHDICQKQIK